MICAFMLWKPPSLDLFRTDDAIVSSPSDARGARAWFKWGVCPGEAAIVRTLTLKSLNSMFLAWGLFYFL